MYSKDSHSLTIHNVQTYILDCTWLPWIFEFRCLLENVEFVFVFCFFLLIKFITKAIKFNCYKIIATNYSQVLQSVPVWNALPNYFGSFFFIFWLKTPYTISHSHSLFHHFLDPAVGLQVDIMLCFSHFEFPYFAHSNEKLCRVASKFQIRNRCIKRMIFIHNREQKKWKSSKTKNKNREWIITNTYIYNIHTKVSCRHFMDKFYRFAKCSLITQR